MIKAPWGQGSNSAKQRKDKLLNQMCNCLHVLLEHIKVLPAGREVPIFHLHITEVKWFLSCSQRPPSVTAPPKLNPPSKLYLERPCQELFEATAPGAWASFPSADTGFDSSSHSSVMLLQDDLNHVMALLSYVTTSWIILCLGWLFFHLIFLSVNDHIFHVAAIYAPLEFLRFHILGIPCVVWLSWTKVWKPF